FERLARGDAISPGAKQLRLTQPDQLAIDEQKNLLQNIFGQRVRADEAEDVTIQRRLQELEQFIECRTVARLGAQDPTNLLFGAVHLLPPQVKRRRTRLGFGGT